MYEADLVTDEKTTKNPTDESLNEVVRSEGSNNAINSVHIVSAANSSVSRNKNAYRFCARSK